MEHPVFETNEIAIEEWRRSLIAKLMLANADNDDDTLKEMGQQAVSLADATINAYLAAGPFKPDR